METVLNHSVEIVRGGRIFVVVNAALGIDIGDLLPNASFAGTNGANPFKQFEEIIYSKDCCTLFQAFIIKDESLADVFVEDFGRPLAELGGTGGGNTVSDGDDGIKRIERRQIFFAVRSSCRDFLGN